MGNEVLFREWIPFPTWVRKNSIFGYIKEWFSDYGLLVAAVVLMAFNFGLIYFQYKHVGFIRPVQYSLGISFMPIGAVIGFLIGKAFDRSR